MRSSKNVDGTIMKIWQHKPEMGLALDLQEHDYMAHSVHRTLNVHTAAM